MAAFQIGKSSISCRIIRVLQNAVQRFNPDEGKDWKPVRGLLYEQGSGICSENQAHFNFAILMTLAHEAMIQNTPANQFLPSNEINYYLNLINSASMTRYILISMTTPLINFIYTQLDIKYTPTPTFISARGNKL